MPCLPKSPKPPAGYLDIMVYIDYVCSIIRGMYVLGIIIRGICVLGIIYDGSLVRLCMIFFLYFCVGGSIGLGVYG